MGLEIARTHFGNADKVEFFRTLSGWLSSGEGRMSVAEAVKFTCETFSRDEYRGFRPRMERIVREVEGGQISFSEALKSSQLGFAPQELAIVEAAEKANQLRIAIPSLVEALEMKQNAVKSLRAKLAMPLIGGVMLILMSIGVMTMMMPTVLGPVLQRKPDALDSMPFVISWYWEMSKWLQSFWYIPLIFTTVVILAILLRNLPLVKPYMEALLMWFTPTYRLILAFNSMLVVFFMPALLRSGMSFHIVLRTLASTLDNASIAGALRVAANDHEGGTSMAESIDILPFKGSFRSAVEAGERTGQVANRVEELKTPYAGDLERVIKQTVGSLTLIVMAVLLPFFLLSMYITLTVPIFALMEY